MAPVTTKSVVDEVSCWLQIYDDGTVERNWTGPPELRFFVESVPPHLEFVNGVATKDVIVDPNTALTVRLYVPQTEPNSVHKLPLLLHFHGGGYCFSRPDWQLYYHFYARLVRVARVVLVSVYLPLAPEHKLPAPCEAAFNAFSWLGSVASLHSREPWLESLTDFQRVFVIGDSTGGNIVHHVAARIGDSRAEPVKLAGGIALHPGFLRAEPGRSFYEKTESPFLTRDMINKFMNLAVAGEASKDHPIISPMGPQAPRMTELKLPPMMVAVAEDDLMFDTEMEYCEAMKEAGKEVEVVLSHGMGHCFYLNKIAVESDSKTASQVHNLIQAIVNFITRH